MNWLWLALWPEEGIDLEPQNLKRILWRKAILVLLKRTFESNFHCLRSRKHIDIDVAVRCLATSRAKDGTV